MKFLAPFYFKCWDHAQSFSSRDRGVLKYVDTVGSIECNNKLFELFFTEVSHGPFHSNPEQHIDGDNFKLSKLGKDALDRNKGCCAGECVGVRGCGCGARS